MQKIILFIEPSVDAFSTPDKIGHIFMNRVAVDEDARFEILNIFELGKTSVNMSWPKQSEYANFEIERTEKGIGLGNIVCILELEYDVAFIV